MDHREYEVI